MSIFNYLKKRTPSASVAKERLQIIISHERAQRSTPDYLPKLQEEIIAVISKYVPINRDQVMVNIDHIDDHSAVLELNITMPEEVLSGAQAQPKSSEEKDSAEATTKYNKKSKKAYKTRAKADA